jgi:hypothetical protein
MNRRKHLLLTPLALAVVFAAGTAATGQSGQAGQPYTAATHPKQSAKSTSGGHWEEHFQGRGNVTNTRCLGMSRGPNCITAASRKDAARRAAAARAAAQQASLPDTGNPGKGGKNK